MKKTGIIRRLDDLGRIVIPKEIRRELCLEDGAPLEITVENSNIVLIPYETKEVREGQAILNKLTNNPPEAMPELERTALIALLNHYLTMEKEDE